MDKLRLRNYRCFDDTGDVELKPITILLGANSSGKSSFIKFFPLLQQSLGTRVNGLFLWDGQYVDFKNFKNTVRNGSGEITIDYSIGTLEFRNLYAHVTQKLHDVVVSMTLKEKEDFYDYLKILEVHYGESTIKYSFNKEGKSCSIEANGIKSDRYSKERIILDTDNNLLPSIRFESESTSFTVNSPLSQMANSELNSLLGKERKSDIDLLIETNNSSLLKLGIAKREDELRKRYPTLSADSIKEAANVLLYMYSGLIIGSVNDYFSRMSKQISYVLPLRSIMNRYYRFQNRNVDSIDPDGDNLAMFYNSLSEKSFEDFNKWLSDIFHFKLFITKSEGHVEMYIEEEGKPQMNLVDVGFGFTQILPILTIIWWSVYGNKRVRNVPITIAIEQPELHLHPRFQASFTEMLANVMIHCKKNDIHIRFIIETHSEVIINKIGQLISKSDGRIGSDDVNVVLFNASNEGLNTYVHSTHFSEDGGLMYWPFGFFAKDVY